MRACGCVGASSFLPFRPNPSRQHTTGVLILEHLIKFYCQMACREHTARRRSGRSFASQADSEQHVHPVRHAHGAGGAVLPPDQPPPRLLQHQVGNRTIGTLCTAFEAHVAPTPTSKRAHKLMMLCTGQSPHGTRRWRVARYLTDTSCIKSFL